MAIRTELSLRLPNSPGELQRLCVTLQDARVSVMALHLESSGRLRLLVDNPLEAAASLREAGHQVDEREVLYTSLPNKPGALAGLARLLGQQGINVEYAYSASVDGAPQGAIVLGVEDPHRAAALIGV